MSAPDGPADILTHGDDPVSSAITLENEPAPGSVEWPAGVLAVRRGPGANCSSIGSAVEMLFLSATIGAAVLGAVVAALRPRDETRRDGDAATAPRGGGPDDPGQAPASGGAS